MTGYQSQDALKQQQAAFENGLSAFENCVDTPFIPGELKQWIDAVSEAFGRLEPAMTRQADWIHSEEFAEIGREDSELLQRVDQMRQEDRDLIAGLGRLEETIRTLRTKVAVAGRDEALLSDELDEFVRTSQEFVARVRKQEVTVRTWWVESFNRDRGTVD